MNLIPRFGFDDLLGGFLIDTTTSGLKSDIYEQDGIYHIELDVPGIKKDNIKIEYEDDYLSIIASAEKSEEDKTRNYIRKERSFAKYERKFYVGKIDTSKIDAKFEDGTLHITFPKEEIEANKTLINVN